MGRLGCSRAAVVLRDRSVPRRTSPPARAGGSPRRKRQHGDRLRHPLTACRLDWTPASARRPGSPGRCATSTTERPAAVGVVQATAVRRPGSGRSDDRQSVRRADRRPGHDPVGQRAPRELHGERRPGPRRPPLSDGRTALLETRDSSGSGWVTLIEESGSVLGVWEVRRWTRAGAFRPHQPPARSHGHPPPRRRAGPRPGEHHLGLADRPGRSTRHDLLVRRLQRRPAEHVRATRARSAGTVRRGPARRPPPARASLSGGSRPRAPSTRASGRRGPPPRRPPGRLPSMISSSDPTAGCSWSSRARRGAQPSTWPGSPAPGRSTRPSSGARRTASLGAGAVLNGTSVAAALAPRGDLVVVARDPPASRVRLSHRRRDQRRRSAWSPR